MDPAKLLTLLSCLLLCMPAGATGAGTGIYQWEDERGAVFGDRPPEGAAARELDLSRGRPERLEIHYHRREGPFSAAAEQRAEQGIRRIFHHYRQDFGLDVRGTVKVNIHLIDNRADLQEWIRSRIGDLGPVRGVFILDTNEVAVWNHGDREQVLATLFHETSHVILHQLAPETPIWLQEGLAQYFETLNLEDPEARPGPLPAAAKRIREWVDDGTLITLSDYLNISEARWRQMAHNQDAVPYTLAWAIVYFLMSHPTGEQTLRRALHDLEKTGTRPTLDRLHRLYPGGLRNLEQRFFYWAQEEL